jgi:hypothetical protein
MNDEFSQIMFITQKSLIFFIFHFYIQLKEGGKAIPVVRLVTWCLTKKHNKNLVSSL